MHPGTFLLRDDGTIRSGVAPLFNARTTCVHEVGYRIQAKSAAKARGAARKEHIKNWVSGKGPRCHLHNARACDAIAHHLASKSSQEEFKERRSKAYAAARDAFVESKLRHSMMYMETGPVWSDVDEQQPRVGDVFTYNTIVSLEGEWDHTGYVVRELWFDGENGAVHKIGGSRAYESTPREWKSTEYTSSIYFRKTKTGRWEECDKDSWGPKKGTYRGVHQPYVEFGKIPTGYRR
jgi:hypothetical protein